MTAGRFRHARTPAVRAGKSRGISGTMGTYIPCPIGHVSIPAPGCIHASRGGCPVAVPCTANRPGRLRANTRAVASRSPFVSLSSRRSHPRQPGCLSALADWLMADLACRVLVSRGDSRKEEEEKERMRRNKRPRTGGAKPVSPFFKQRSPRKANPPAVRLPAAR